MTKCFGNDMVGEIWFRLDVVSESEAEIFSSFFPYFT